jgi:hypothetical protein
VGQQKAFCVLFLQNVPQQLSNSGLGIFVHWLLGQVSKFLLVACLRGMPIAAVF